MTEQWCFSLDNTKFTSGTFDSKKLALEAGQKEGLLLKEGGEAISTIFVAPCKYAQNSQMYPDAELILEHMACQAEDIGREFAESYPDCDKEAEKELTEKMHALLDEWCSKHSISPTFYTIGESMEFDLVTLKRVKK